MQLGIAQVDPTVADFAGNADRILRRYRTLAEAGADLVVTPELALCGYPGLDLWFRQEFFDGCQRAFDRLVAQIDGPPLLLGSLRTDDGFPALRNSVFWIEGGAVRGFHDKRLLPTYDVFDEARYFSPGDRPTVWSIGGRSVGIAICEEIWDPDGACYPVDPINDLKAAGADLIISPSASPYHAGKRETRRALFTRQAERAGVPLLFVNQVGANTELIFDGTSLLATGSGVVFEAASFEEDAALVSLDALDTPLPPRPSSIDEVRQALVLGIRGYFQKCGIGSAWIGLSGGIDSALVAALATEALGAENVHGVAMPSRYSSEGSRTDARELAETLGIHFEEISIESAHRGFQEGFASALGAPIEGLAEENLQARIRGTILMARSNARGGAVLATGNKSEIGVGYCTLYGDMCGALAPIGDLTKGEVYELSRAEPYRSQIPASTIEKPPSAELRPDQLDTDSLPEYDLLDPILVGHVVEEKGRKELIAEGADPQLVHDTVDRIFFHEYKRTQAAPILRVSPRAFGVGRRVPLARGRDETDRSV